MAGPSRLRIVFVIGTLALVQVACATRGSYNALEQERDLLRDQLDALAVEMEDAQSRLAATEAASFDNASRSAALIRELEAEVAAGEARVQ